MFVPWVIIFLVVCVVCKGTPTPKCGPDKFPCFDGSCVEKLKWCDSTADCDDDSDEMYCYTKSGLIQNPNGCDEAFYFLCRDGRCIPLVGQCDGYPSCYDNSDEENCGTETNDTEVFAHLSATPVSLQRVITELPKATHFNYSGEALEGSHIREDVLQTDLSVSRSTNYVATVKSVNLPDDVVQVYSDSGSSNINATLKHVGLHDDIVQAPVSQNEISDSTTSKKVDFHDSEENSAFFTSTEMALELHDDILQDSVSGKKPARISLKDVNHHDTSRANSVSYSTSRDDSVMKHTSLHDGLKAMSTASINVNQTDVSLKRMDAHNAIQADSSASLNISSEEEDLERGFIELNSRHFRRERDSAQQWLLKHRDEDYGWGDETARAITALYLLDDELMKKQFNEKLLMSKQLHLKLFTALIRNQTKPISLGELSLYVNALSASCDNPKNFYGQDLINTLRHRTNACQGSSEFVSPLVYLTLCLNNATTYEDVRKIQEMYGTPKISKIDFEALVSLAATCISRIPMFSGYGIGQHIARSLYRKIIAEGLPENIYELALVSQALNEARINQGLWNRSGSMHLISVSQEADGSFSDILSTYYAVPILSGKSLVSLTAHCHRSEDKGLIPLEVLKNGREDKIYVQFSLFFGNPVEVSQSLQMKVQKSSNFLDIMRIAETINPIYKFRYDTSRGKPTVYSIGGIVNDAEQGLYWTLHVSSRLNSTEEDLVPYEGDIRSFIPSPGDYLVFWMKSIF